MNEYKQRHTHTHLHTRTHTHTYIHAHTHTHTHTHTLVRARAEREDVFVPVFFKNTAVRVGACLSFAFPVFTEWHGGASGQGYSGRR